ncbi:MAG: hypothetical protein L0K86_04280 [Actinomycetia bacterium]|nr:hypothetical protein [Actinomycetes bacterium]
MIRLRRRDRGGKWPSILSRLRAVGETVKRRTFPVRNGSGTENRRVVARVRGVEGAPITHPERYGDPASLDRAYEVMTRTSDSEQRP